MNNAYLDLDWLAFTFHGNTYDNRIPFYQFIDAFPELADVIASSCVSTIKSNYNHTITYYDDIIFCYNDIEEDLTPTRSAALFNQGVNVQVPSHSLETFFKFFNLDREDPSAVPKLFDILVSRNCHLSRIDLCYDDFEYRETVTTRFYCLANVEERIQTPAHQLQGIRDKGTGAYTFYVGSLKKRDKLLRIYDKFIQSNGEVDSVRYEFELHADKAKAMEKYILDLYHEGTYAGGIDFVRFLLGWIKVKVAGDSNLSRADLDPQFSAFLSRIVSSSLNLTHSSIIPIRIPKYDSTKREKEITRFVVEQAMPSVAGYVQCFGWNRLRSDVTHHIKSGRINDKYVRMHQKIYGSREFETNKYSFENPFLFKDTYKDVVSNRNLIR